MSDRPDYAAYHESYEIVPHRIYVEWSDGSWMTSEAAHFQHSFHAMVDQKGHPVKVEFREKDTGVTVESHARNCECEICKD